MTRRTWSAVLALSLAGGVYLAATSASASNMGFKLERDYDFKRTSAPGNAPLRNIYFVSFPLFNGLGDVADGVSLDPASGGTLPYKSRCIGDSNGPPGPGDGLINAWDALCDSWTGRNDPGGGVFIFQYYDSQACTAASVSGQRRFGFPEMAGTAFPAAGTDLWTDIGYQINVLAQQGFPDPRNRAVIVGSHDPSFAGHTIHFSTTCGSSAAPRQDLVAMAYHAMYEGSNEVLCGLKGVVWTDTDDNELPDDPPQPGFCVCCGGIFDDQVGPTHSITINTFQNGDPALGQPLGMVPQTARRSAFGFSLNPPEPFALVPGEAYFVAISPAHVDTILRPPHF